MPKKLSIEDVNSKIASRGITMIDPYINNGTKSKFMCDKRHTWMATPHNILKGRGCPHCAGKLPLQIEQINEKLSPRGIMMVGPYTNIRTKTKFSCQNGHTWEAMPDNVINKEINCPCCSVNSRKLTTDIVNDRLLANNRGIRTITEYVNNSTKSEFICDLGHTWKATPAHVLHGSGCPECADHSGGGYNPSKPGTFYALDFVTFIKYGITNNLQRRLAQHKKTGNYTLALAKSFEDGSIAQKLEQEIDKKFGGRFATKEQCPDGYTETLCPSKLSVLLEIVTNR